MRRSAKTPSAAKQQRGAATSPAKVRSATVADPATEDTRAGLDDLLRRLDTSAQATPPVTGGALATVASEASGHADVLRSTLNAQHEAHEMLSLARKARDSASEQAEEIVREAKEVALRLEAEAREHAEQARQENTTWASEQRKTIDAVIKELIEAATRDAETIRAEALQHAMTEAEHTAQQYVSLAAASGARDAEHVRAEARELMVRSRQLVDGTTATLHTLTTTMSDAMMTMQSQMEALTQLLAETAPAAELAATPRPPVLALLSGDGTPSKHSAADAESSAGDQQGDDDREGRPLGSLFRGTRQSEGGW